MLIRSLPLAALALLLTTATAAAAPVPSSAAPRCDEATFNLQTALNHAAYPAGAPDGCTGPATRAAVQAFQRAQGLGPDGVVGPMTRDALRRPRPVKPVFRSPKTHVEIDIRRQLLVLVGDGAAVAVYAASTGRRGHETPTGRFRVAYQQTRSWSFEYSTWLPWASYFVASRGIAVHAGNTPPRPDSHGCVRAAVLRRRRVPRDAAGHGRHRPSRPCSSPGRRLRLARPDFKPTKSGTADRRRSSEAVAAEFA